jgi:hypothetical protein
MSIINQDIATLKEKMDTENALIMAEQSKLIEVQFSRSEQIRNTLSIVVLGALLLVIVVVSTWVSLCYFKGYFCFQYRRDEKDYRDRNQIAQETPDEKSFSHIAMGTPVFTDSVKRTRHNLHHASYMTDEGEPDKSSVSA